MSAKGKAVLVQGAWIGCCKPQWAAQPAYCVSAPEQRPTGYKSCGRGLKRSLPPKSTNAVLHAQAAVTIAVLALGVAMHARLLALFRLLTQGGSVLRNLLVRSPHLCPNDSLCIQPPCP